jgi:hypothetical protein
VISRRELLGNSGKAIGLTIFTSFPVARAIAGPVDAWGDFARVLAAGRGHNLSPQISLLLGLAEFAEGLSERGLPPSTLSWTDASASSDDAMILLLGLRPTGASYSSGTVSIRGVPDSKLGYLAAVDRRVFYPYPLYGEPIEETRFTPDGIPYTEVEVYPRTEPVVSTIFSLVDQTNNSILSSVTYTLPDQ